MKDIEELNEVIALIKREFPATECCGVSRQKELIEEVIKIYAGAECEEKEPWRE